jgi:hypothetical protein
MAAINLSEVSPSSVGDYMVCPWKLVADTDFPEEEDNTYRPHRDFGTVCHWHGQVEAGAPPDPAELYTDEQVSWAKKCPGVPSTDSFFWKRVEKVAKFMASTLHQISPLTPGTEWVAEYNKYDKNILPDRVSRSGKKGFGGKIDLLRSDRAIMWDYKVTGRLPDKAKVVYIVQCLSYHVVTEVPITGILWVNREGTQAAYLKIDWTTELGQLYKKMFMGFLRFIQYENFRDLAWCVPGEACFFCDHKRRCPAKAIPRPTDITMSSRFSSAPSEQMKGLLDEALAVSGVQEQVIDSPRALPPPPPPVDEAHTVEIVTEASPLMQGLLDEAMALRDTGLVIPPSPSTEEDPKPAAEDIYWVMVTDNGEERRQHMTETEMLAWYEAGYEGPVVKNGESQWQQPENYGFTIERRAEADDPLKFLFG